MTARHVDVVPAARDALDDLIDLDALVADHAAAAVTRPVPVLVAPPAPAMRPRPVVPVVPVPRPAPVAPRPAQRPAAVSSRPSSRPATAPLPVVVVRPRRVARTVVVVAAIVAGAVTLLGWAFLAAALAAAVLAGPDVPATPAPAPTSTSPAAPGTPDGTVTAPTQDGGSCWIERKSAADGGDEEVCGDPATMPAGSTPVTAAT